MKFTSYPKGFAPHKPQQTITLLQFLEVLKNGGYATKKYDGNRCHILVMDNGDIQIFSRNGTLNWSGSLPNTIEHIKTLNIPNNSFVDAELYIPNQENVEAVQLIVNSGSDEKGAKAEAELNPKLAVFDVLYYQGIDMVKKPLEERLKTFEGHVSEQVHYVERREITTLEDAMELVKKEGIEGLVLVDPNAPHNLNYNGNTKRGNLWKIKIRPTEDMVATSFTMSKDPSLGVGTLKVYRYNPEIKALCVGNVGSFEVSFDRKEAVNYNYPIAIEVSHFGLTKKGHLNFPKIIRRREDLEAELLSTFKEE